ncbi:MAG: LysR substrate-binding domain-containing protein [Devosia sp.]|nr:LysR substrate-binding domain-containing protein [Devosia sp.]
MAVTTHLGSLQALELAVRTGSLKAAADILHITPAAVGQRIKLLEDYLGVDLLARGRSGIRPTRALEDALPHLGAAFRELDTTARLLDFQRVHELQIVADPDWADLWLKPRLGTFKAAHPNVRFCINGVGDVPLRLGAADCEIWFGPPRDTGAEEELYRDYVVALGSHENVGRVAHLPPADRVEGFPLLHVDSHRDDPTAIGWSQWTSRLGHRRTHPNIGPRYRTVVDALEAVYSSAGFILCGLSLMQPALDAGRLTLLFPDGQGMWAGQPYRMVFRDSSLRRSQTAEFRAWLMGEAKATAAVLNAMVVR